MIFEDVEPTPKMQVAFSKVFGPLKDHPSKAVPRAGGEDMLGVIEMRHEPNEPGSRPRRRSGAVAVAAVALRPLLQRRAQPRRRAARGRGPARRRPDRLRRRHRPVRRDLARGARPDRGRDRDLRDGRDHGEPPVRSAGRVRRRRAGRERRRRDGGVRGSAPRAPPRGLDSQLGREGPARLAAGWRRASRVARIPTATRCSPRCATRSSRRRRTSATSTSGSRPTWSSGTTGACSTRCRGCRPNTRVACTARPSRATTASADSKRPLRRTPAPRTDQRMKTGMLSQPRTVEVGAS